MAAWCRTQGPFFTAFDGWSLFPPVLGLVREELDRHPQTPIRKILHRLAAYSELNRFAQLNALRCFILPVAYGIFLAVAQIFLTKPNNVSSTDL